MSIAYLILSGVVAVGGVVSALLHKSGKDKAADVVDTVVRLIKALIGILQGTTDPKVKAEILNQIRSHLAELDSINTPYAKAAAAVIRKELSSG